MKNFDVDNPESKIISAIDHSDIINLTRTLVHIPSINPPGQEKGVAEFISSWFEKKRDYDISWLEATQGRPNVIVNSRNLSGKKVIFNGHMDVVPPGNGWSVDPFGGEIIGDRMYGRGVADMKGALAAMMVAMDALNSQASESLDGSITFMAVVDEEKGGYFGTNQVVKKGISADFAIIGEPTGLNVASAHKGNLTFEIVTFGKSAHASMPKNGVNAVLKMCEIISAFKRYSERLEKRKPHPLLGWPTFNVGTIEGGVKSNVVPESCRITAERRLVIPETIHAVKQEIYRILQDLNKEDPELKYKLNFLEEVGPSEMPDCEKLLNAAIESLGDVGKKVVSPIGFEATCDAYYLNSIAKIPTIILGPGLINDIHKPDEFIYVTDLFAAAKVYALTAFRLLKSQT